MSTRGPNIPAEFVGNVREAFGRVVYSHKTHEKAREIESRRVTLVKWTNIVLTTLTSGALLETLITNARAGVITSAILSALALAFVIFQFSFNPESEADRHRMAAKELWYIREKYVNLLSDLSSEISLAEATKRRDELTDELKDVYAQSPNTSPGAYKAAQKALKISEDMTFSDTEIDQFLPSALREEGDGRGEDVPK